MANTLNEFRDGASLPANSFGVTFIDWLDLSRSMPCACLGIILRYCSESGAKPQMIYQRRLIIALVINTFARLTDAQL